MNERKEKEVSVNQTNIFQKIKKLKNYFNRKIFNKNSKIETSIENQKKLLNKWKIVSSSFIGRGHVQSGTPCQDKTFQLVDIKEDFYGLALADGAGSCKYSEEGAEFITKEILHYIKQNFNTIFNIDKTDNFREKFLLQHIENSLRKKAKEKDYKFKDLSSTLLFVVVKKEKYIFGHIGDGVIGSLDNQDNLQVISLPENGEYANSTFFTTTTIYKDRLRIRTGALTKTMGFILMSDGAGESLYNKGKKSLSPGNKTMFDWLKDNEEKKVEEALYKNLEQVLSKKTTDDCSIGIMRIREGIGLLNYNQLHQKRKGVV